MVSVCYENSGIESLHFQRQFKFSGGRNSQIIKGWCHQRLAVINLNFIIIFCLEGTCFKPEIAIPEFRMYSRLTLKELSELLHLLLSTIALNKGAQINPDLP